MNTNIVQVKRALISVSDKTGIVEFAQALNKLGVEIISTGGTAKALAAVGIPVIEISQFTGFPEIMDGRVKTLHPFVHGGILGLRDKHADIAKEQNIRWIDLVVCNLYPFAQTLSKQGVSEEEIIENIDIGGPSMIRSSAKNVGWVASVTNSADYSVIISELETQGGITYETRRRLSADAYAHTAQYDAVIANHFRTQKFPQHLTLTFDKFYDLRYGENPHQEACVYQNINNSGNNILSAKILQGKQLSYNNIGDADAALSVIREFSDPACAVIKHANPCGVANGKDIDEAYQRAYAADPLSAFGGVIALNRTVTKSIAEHISTVFAEIIIAPGFEPEALNILSTKKNLRLLELSKINLPEPKVEFKYVDGGLLLQDADTKALTDNDLKVVTTKKPTESELSAMMFAWKILKHIKSNAILITQDGVTVGVGAGQVSRVDAVDLAIKKGGDKVIGSILASDAFFPFRDSIDKIAAAGIKAIIQPGGSIKDAEVIAACDELGITMIFTGVRSFKH